MIRASFSTGWHAFVHRWGALVAASALILAVALPINVMAGIAGRSLEEISLQTESISKSKHELTPEEAGERLRALLTPGIPCCFGACGDLLLTVFLMAPIIAGASISAAQSVAGRPGLPLLFSGFRRYWTVVGVGTLCLALGGGVGVLASAIASIGARAGVAAVGRATSATMGPIVETGYWVMVVLLVVSIVWFSARLWFALYRLLDPERPPVRARQAIAWSWSVTRGGVQWQILTVLVLLGVIAGVLQIPAEWMAVQQGAALQWGGLVLGGAMALLVWVPLTLAISGAMYAQAAAMDAG